MNDEPQHNRLRTLLKGTGIALAVVLLLLVAARLALNTDTVRNWVKERAVEMVNSRINGTLTAGRLEGDLWKEARLSDIRLVRDDTSRADGGTSRSAGDPLSSANDTLPANSDPDQAIGDTLLAVDTLALRYDIFSLLGPVFQVHELRITGPLVRLVNRDGRWSTEGLLREAGTETTDDGGFDLEIADIGMSEGRLELRGMPALPDSSLTATDIALQSGFSYREGSYDLQLRELSFLLQRNGAGDPLNVSASAGATDGRVTLERLVVATGNSLVRSSGSVDLGDTAADLQFTADPLSLADLDRLADVPAASDRTLDAALQLSGTPSRFTVTLSAASADLEQFRLSGTLAWRESPVLEQVELQLARADLEALTGGVGLPVLRNLRLSAEGALALDNYQEGAMKGRFGMGRTRLPGTSHTADTLGGTFSLDGRTAGAKLSLRMGRQAVDADVQLSNFWEGTPTHRTTAEIRGLDPGYWLEDPDWMGSASLRLRLNGRGWVPGDTPWNYEMNVRDLRMAREEIPQVEGSVTGSVTRDSLYADARLRSGSNSIHLLAGVGDYSERPRFRYELETEGFDVSAFRGMEEFPTALNLTARGEGSGSALESLTLESTVEVDSSVVNGEFIRSFSATVAVRDTVATLRDGRLASTIAKGTVEGRFHLQRYYDRANELNLEMELLDIQSLAPLADARTLFATGTVSGRLYPVLDNELEFNGKVDLIEVNYDSTFTAREAMGNVQLRLGAQSRYTADLELASPVIATVLLQDLRVVSQGKIDSVRASGSFQLSFSSTADGDILHAGTYDAAPDSLVLHTTTYRLTSSVRTLTLDRPFRLRYYDGAVQMDTMRLASEDDRAFVELAIPHADTLRQEGYLRGQDLNTTVIQNTLLGESWFEGLLSGELRVNRSDTATTAHGNLVLSEFLYRGMELDTLELDFGVAGERLDGTLSLRTGGEELVRGELHVPFRLGDPSGLPESFFRQPVSGRLEARSVDLARFEGLLEEAGITGTGGLFTFNGTLSGSAGEPEIRARTSLSQAVLSGVSVDTVRALLDYSHRQSRVTLNASVTSLRQRAAEITARVPFYLDFRELTASFPQAEDSISVDVVTNNFNLAALNDFVDRQQVREISGTVNGVLQMDGRVDNLQAEGQLDFRNGALRLVDAGIRVDRIGSTLNFEPGRVVLQDFSARSGNGTLRAEGSMRLQQLRPGEMDVTVTARNFKAANTSRYNASVNLDARAQGTPGQPQVTGNLEVLNGFIIMDNFGERSVEQIELDSLDTPDFRVSLYDSLSLDMDLSFNRRFFVRNRRYLEMEMELEGQVDLLKESGEELQVFGTLSSVRGYASPLGKRFQLEEGVLTFSGDPYNPQIQVRSLYEPPQTQQDIRIWYVIEGTVEDPQFKYESTPPMELENIISYTLFGQPFYALDSWKQVVAGTGSNASAAEVALDVLLDRVESLATRRLGIDLVQIDNTRVGGESGTAITTGWYINPRVFFAIQNVITDATPDTSFLLEYLLRKNLKLIISQGNDSRQGVDLKWNFDY